MNRESYLASLKRELANARRSRPDVVGQIDHEIARVEREIAQQERASARIISMVARRRKQVAEEPPEPQVYGAFS